jgi:hypothetical protein
MPIDITSHATTKGTTFNTVLVMMTPALAMQLMAQTQEVLDRDPEAKINRSLKPDRVALYTRDMLNGRWVATAEPVSLDSEGAVLNGQHRLRACIASNVSFPCTIATNVNRAAFEVFDSGASRLHADGLKIAGEKNALLLSATLSYLRKYETGNMGSNTKISNMELNEVLERHPGVRNHVQIVASFEKGLKVAACSTVSYLGALVDPQLAGEFMFKLKTGGGNIRRNDPSVIMSRTFIAGVQSARGTSETFTRMVFAVKAMNAALQNREIKVLRTITGETFPSMPNLPYGTVLPSLSVTARKNFTRAFEASL